jgi:hypothetical protein
MTGDNMSAHTAGAASRSWRQFERQRQAALERQGDAQREKHAFMEVLAGRLASECNLPLAIARKHVEQVSMPILSTSRR